MYHLSFKEFTSENYYISLLQNILYTAEQKFQQLKTWVVFFPKIAEPQAK